MADAEVLTTTYGDREDGLEDKDIEGIVERTIGFDEKVDDGTIVANEEEPFPTQRNGVPPESCSGGGARWAIAQALKVTVGFDLMVSRNVQGVDDGLCGQGQRGGRNR